MTNKWTEGVLLKFLDLYRKHDCLWNSHLDIYKNRDARENALQSMVNEMEVDGLTVYDLKTKIKTIRTMYKREHSLIYKSKQNGHEEPYIPRLFWYNRADAFLSEVTNERDTSANSNLPQSYGSETETTEIKTELPDEYEFNASTSASVGNVDTQEEVIYDYEFPENTETVNKSRKQPKRTHVFHSQNRKRKFVDDNIVSSLNAAVDKLDKVVQNDKNPNDDEFDIFGKYVAIQLKQMPLYDAIICEDEIQKVVRKKRLEILARQTQ